MWQHFEASFVCIVVNFSIILLLQQSVFCAETTHVQFWIQNMYTQRGPTEMENIHT